MKTSTAFILLLISVALYFSFTSDQYAQVGGLRTEAGNYTSVLANVSSLEEKRDALKVKYNNIPPSEVTALNRVLPTSNDTVNLALDLDAVASRYGISIKNITSTVDQSAGGQVGSGNTPDATIGAVAPPPEPYQKATVNFSFVATYDNFRKFLADIEHSLRLVDIQKVDFQVGTNGLSQYTVTAQTYYTPSQ